jgi:hypothetical protein
MGGRELSARPRSIAPRPSAPRESVCILGAVRPQDGEGGALVPPFHNTAAMNPPQAAISAMVSAGRHAVPDNITLLPPECPALHVMENVRQLMRGNCPSNWRFRHHATSPSTAATTATAASRSPGASSPSGGANGRIAPAPRPLASNPVAP